MTSRQIETCLSSMITFVAHLEFDILVDVRGKVKRIIAVQYG